MALNEYQKLEYEIMREKVSEVFSKHPHDYVAKMEELGFEYFETDEDYEAEEERKAKPENQRQKDIVEYFENNKQFSKKIFESYSKEKAAENPNYPLFRKYYKQANKNLKALLIYGLDNYPDRTDLFDDLSFFHEFGNILTTLIAYYTRVCIDEANLDTFSELAKKFYYATEPDGYNAYYALRDLFKLKTTKRKIIDFLIDEAEASEKEGLRPIEF